MLFSPYFFFVLSRFRVFFSDGSSKTLHKTFCQKNRVEKSFTKTKKFDQNPKPTFSRIFLSRFRAFLDEGSSKLRLKKIEKNLTLVLFRTPTHPPTTGVADFFLLAPCVLQRLLSGCAL
jgi:hypothetical protein